MEKKDSKLIVYLVPLILFIASGAKTIAALEGSGCIAQGLVCSLPASVPLQDTVEGVFERIEELENQRKERSRHYRSSLGDEELAKIYARATAPQRIRPDNAAFAASALKKVKEDRQYVLDLLNKRNWIHLSDKDTRIFKRKSDKLIAALTALGPEAVEAIIGQLRLYGGRNRWYKANYAKQAVRKMGSQAIQALSPLMHNYDSFQREAVADLLCKFADPQSKEVLYDALDDDSAHVRESALQGLLTLGPKVVGTERLIRLLIRALEDDYFWSVWTAIDGLKENGDLRAIEPLQIIERYHLGRGKGDPRFHAQRAINAILARAGREVQERQRSDYENASISRAQFLEAAVCSNAGIRLRAVRSLDRYKDEQMVRFLIDRIAIERSPKVLEGISHILHRLMAVPKGTTKSDFDASFVQLAFDALVAAAKNNPLVYVDAKTLSLPVDGKTVKELRLSAFEGAAIMLHLADAREIDLQNLTPFKHMVLECMNSKGHVRCYSAVTAIAAVCKGTDADFSAGDKNFLHQQFTSFLQVTYPDVKLIRAIGSVGDKQFTPRLIELLQHEYPLIRRDAASALGRIADLSALRPLQDLAETAPVEPDDEAVLKAMKINQKL